MAVATAAWVVGKRLGWDQTDLIAILAVIVPSLLVFAGPIFARILEESRNPATADDLELIRKEMLHAVRRLRTDVALRGDVSQLDRLTAGIDDIGLKLKKARVEVTADAGGKVKLTGSYIPLSEIVQRWASNPHRLVLLGEKGAGKTVAALQLCQAVNNEADRQDKPICELFALAEWGKWIRTNPDATLRDWIASQLYDRYGISLLSARDLIARNLIIPIFDGLDELRPPLDADCARLLQEYYGIFEPFRPFALTCRATEYAALGTGCPDTDELVALTSLQQPDIVKAVSRRCSRDPGWRPVCEKLEAGDQALLALFSTPLRLSLAFDVLTGMDPAMIVGLPAERAKQLLWQLKLRADRGSMAVRDTPVSSAGIEWLAVAMGDQATFWLHDLYRYAPDRPQTFRRFRAVLFLVGYICVTYVVWRCYAAFHSATRSGFGNNHLSAIFSLFLDPIVLMVVLFVGAGIRFSEGPSAGLARTRRVRESVDGRMLGRVCSRSFGVSACIAVIAGLALYRNRVDTLVVIDVAIGLFLLAGVGLGVIGCMRSLSPIVGGADIGIRGPRDLLNASASSGVKLGMFGAVIVGLSVAVPMSILVGKYAYYYHVGGSTYEFRSDIPYGALVGLRIGLLSSLAAACILCLAFGLDAYIYHYILRFRLRSLGVPVNVEAYLNRCAGSGLGWIRKVGGSYEFYHREFHEFLKARDSGSSLAASVAADSDTTGHSQQPSRPFAPDGDA